MRRRRCRRPERDWRITFTGQITPEAAATYVESATVLVNPRPNGEAYTRYSFPSKNIDYLLSGKPVVAFVLDGMSPDYRNFLFEARPDCDPAEALRAAIEAAIQASPEEVTRRWQAFLRYASDRLLARTVAETILRISFDGEE